MCAFRTFSLSLGPSSSPPSPDSCSPSPRGGCLGVLSGARPKLSSDLCIFEPAGQGHQPRCAEVYTQQSSGVKQVYGRLVWKGCGQACRGNKTLTSWDLIFLFNFVAIIERTRDAKEAIRRDAYLWLAEKCSIRNFTMEKRIQVQAKTCPCSKTTSMSVSAVELIHPPIITLRSSRGVRFLLAIFQGIGTMTEGAILSRH